MVVVLVALALVLVAALAAIGHELVQLRRALAQLEGRVAALELAEAPTIVTEPERNEPPRPPNALMN